MIFWKSTGGTVKPVPAGTEDRDRASSAPTQAAVSSGSAKALRMASAELGMKGSETTE